VWAKTVILDQWNKVGSVEQEEHWAKNQTLQYTTHDQSQR